MATDFLNLSDINLIEPNTLYILCFLDIVDLGGYCVIQ